jgi:thiamine transporter
VRTAPHDELLQLIEAATAVALCVLLGNLRLLELPSGGSISLAAVPLLAYAALRGGRGAVLAGACAGGAHALAGGTIIHPLQLLLDYGLAYAVLAVPALLGASTRLRLTVGILAAMALQWAVTTLSGVLFFATVAGGAAWRYSALYNATTAIPETLMALAAVPVAIRALQRADPARGGLLVGVPAPVRRLPRIAHVHRPAGEGVRVTPPPPRGLQCGAPIAAGASVTARTSAARTPTMAREPGAPLLGRPAPFAAATRASWRRSS